MDKKNKTETRDSEAGALPKIGLVDSSEKLPSSIQLAIKTEVQRMKAKKAQWLSARSQTATESTNDSK